LLLIKGILERFHDKFKVIPYLNSEARPKVRDSSAKTAVPLLLVRDHNTNTRISESYL
jgi:hypothetical protein